MSNSACSEDGRIPVFLLKTKSIPNDGYQEQFSVTKDGISFAPTFVPVLEHQFKEVGLAVVREALQKEHFSKTSPHGWKWGGLIFTSQRAVEAFAKLVEEGKGDRTWPHLQWIPIYTVGPATSRALEAIPQDYPLNIFGAETGNGEALAHYMLKHYKGWYDSGQAVPGLLFLVGDQRRDIIPKTLMNPDLPADKRIHVDELVVYGTGVMESFEKNFSELLQATEEKPIRWVVVFSPTGCEAMLRSLNLLDPDTGKVKKVRNEESRRSTFIATIGPTTRDYLKETFGFEPDVCAAKPSPEGIEAGIREFMVKESTDLS